MPRSVRRRSSSPTAPAAPFDFVSRDLKQFSPGNWSAVIPPAATGGAEVAYTIRVENDAGDAVAAQGSAANPIVVKINAPATTAKKHRGRGHAGEPGGDEPGDDEAERKAAPGEPPQWFFGLGVGTGYGWASGFADLNSDTKVTPHFGTSQLGHALPEIGYFASPDLLLSLQVRWQAVSGATSVRDPTGAMCLPSGVCKPATGALAVFGRLTWLFSDGVFRPYLAASVGAGQIRHLASFPNAVSCGSDVNHPVKCVDTVAAGPILVGPGAGFFVNVTPNFAFTAGLNTFLGFAVFTFHVDLNAGIAIQL